MENLSIKDIAQGPNNGLLAEQGIWTHNFQLIAQLPQSHHCLYVL